MVKKLLLGLLLITSFLSAETVDIDMLLERAKSEDRHIMFFAHIPGCPYCKKMLDVNFKDSEIKELIDKNFLLVDLYTKDPTIVKHGSFQGKKKKFARRLKALAYPATVFMDKNGKVVYRSIGYRNLGEYLAELNYIGSKSYKTTDLDSFRENFEFERED